MSESLLPLVLVSLFLTFAGIFIYAQWKQQRTWEEVAQRLRFRYGGTTLGGRPWMEGQQKGVNVRAQVEVHGSGKSRRVLVRYTATRNVRGHTPMRITAEDFGDAVAKLFGGQDIQVGIPEVDRRLRIRGDHPEAIQKLLRQARPRAAIMRFVTARKRAEVTESKVSFATDGLTTSRSSIQEGINAVVHAALALDGSLDALQQAQVDVPEDWGSGVPASDASLPRQAPPQRTASPPTRALPPPAPPEPMDPIAPENLLPVPLQPEMPVEPHTPPELAPQADPEMLARLANPSLLRSERAALAAQFQGSQVQVEVEIGWVSWTMGDVPAHLKDGRTVVGRTPDGLSVAVRIPATRTAEVENQPTGARVQVLATVATWDEFYDRLVLDA